MMQVIDREIEAIRPSPLEAVRGCDTGVFVKGTGRPTAGAFRPFHARGMITISKISISGPPAVLPLIILQMIGKINICPTPSNPAGRTPMRQKHSGPPVHTGRPAADASTCREDEPGAQ